MAITKSAKRITAITSSSTGTRIYVGRPVQRMQRRFLFVRLLCVKPTNSITIIIDTSSRIYKKKKDVDVLADNRT